MYASSPSKPSNQSILTMETETEAEKQERHNNYLNELAEQDRWLPINNVARLMKNTLPATTKVSKDAKECMQECVSEFISFVTSEACDRCASGKRKTINGEDILISLHALGFENYAEILKIYLAKYRQQQAIKNQMLYSKDDAEQASSTSEPASTVPEVEISSGHVAQHSNPGQNKVHTKPRLQSPNEPFQSSDILNSVPQTESQPRIVVQQPLGSRHAQNDQL